MNAIDMALQLVEEGERDPVRAVRNQEKLGKVLRRLKSDHLSAKPANDGAGSSQLATVLARIELLLEAMSQPLAALGVTHIVRVDDVPTLIPGKESPLLRIDWPGGGGKARSMYAGSIEGGRTNTSQVSVRIAIDGDKDLFTTGSAPAFVPLVALQAKTNHWFRLRDYAVSPLQKWTVVFKHEGQAGSNPITPFLLFGFIKGKEQ